MSEKIALDISALGDAAGARRETVLLPDGSAMERHSWTVENLLAGLEAAKKLAAEKRPVVLSGGAPTWVVGALACCLEGLPLSFWLPALGLELPIPELPAGAPRPEGGIRFELTEKEDRIFLEYFADNPNGPAANGPHNYDIAKLASVAVPEIDAGKHLFLRAHGAFPVTVAIVRAYMGKCKSIYMIFGEESAFTCAASFCPEKKVGDRQVF